MKNKKYLLFLLLIPVIIIVGRSFAFPINGEIKTVEINSDNYDEEGSYSIKKTVEWKEAGKAQIVYNVKTIEKKANNNYKDIVLVLDTSNSMIEGKLEKAVSDSIELIRSLLTDLNNRVALISFNTTATIKSDFTNNKEELENILNSLTISSKANFNKALLKVNELLSDYDDLDNHELIVLFLTDGNPNEGIPNDKATYEMLKDKYENIIINGIQFEKDITIADGIKNISDNQFVVGDNNILTEAILTSIPYERFNVIEIINNEHFSIDSIDDIKVNNGTVELTNENNNQKINWNLANTKSGVTSTMIVNVNLNSNLVNQDGLYKVNNTTTINSKLQGASEKTLTSDKTLLLKNKYDVVYNLNKPSSCDLESISSESHFVGESVLKKTQSLYCDGYVIKSWVIKDNEGVKNINNDTFVMPNHDVTISAVWVKNGIEKSMDGLVLEKANTLYRVLQEAAIEGTYAKEYTGPHQDSNTKEATKSIYHWHADNSDEGNAISNMNYVKFGDYCWNMIRTTDTGGVRLLYRGAYDDETKCQPGKGGISYASSSTYTLYINPSSSYYNYYYGTDYTYNEETHKFQLAGDIVQKNLSESDIEDYIGMYTCQTSTLGDCSYLYRLHSKQSSDYVNLTVMYYTSNAYQSIGSAYYYFNPLRYSLSGLGYMYGDDPRSSSSITDVNSNIKFGAEPDFIFRETINNRYYASSEIEKAGVENGVQYYRLKNPVQMISVADRSTLVGMYYTTGSATSTFSSPRIVGDIDSHDILYYILLDRSSDNSDIQYTTIKLGNSITKNADGLYELNNITSLRLSTFVANRNSYVGKYICIDGSTACENPWKIKGFYCYQCDSTGTIYYSYMELKYEDGNTELLVAKNRNENQLLDTQIVNKFDMLEHMSNYSEYKYTCGNTSATCDNASLRLIAGGSRTSSSSSLYAYNNKYYYGSDVTWDGTKYTLVNPVELEVYKDNDLFNHHHYVCLSEQATSCREVAYVFYTNISNGYGYLYYVLLENGETDIQGIFNSQYRENKNDSYMKSVIDYWYSKNMTKYTNYLEDAVYCNNRDMELNGWNPNGGNIFTYDNVNDPYNYDHVANIKCNQETDRFSMDNPKAQLKYPVGLLSYDEMLLLNKENARKHSAGWLTMSPINYASSGSFIYVGSDGYMGTTSYYNIVPAITLKYGTEYISGDGSMDNPYIVDTGEVDE